MDSVFKHIIIRSIFHICDNVAFLRFSHSGKVYGYYKIRYFRKKTHRFIWPPILIVHILLPAEAEWPLLPPPQLPAAERPLVILKVISAGATVATVATVASVATAASV